ncbi:MAG: glycerol-3-phosphate dehydrogenase/oxidase [Desulfobacteraceae bacterium]|nr:glycerol-3-phosphate dehydrogenase/oxidase [Desulfobacteraceae bacterium]
MKRYTEHIKHETFDVVTIGGGITGATIAYEAATRGLKVALLEKGDFSEATSAASSKLIHGGLRYLSNLEYALVRESLRERRVMTNIAPNFVYPVPILFPHYQSSRRTNKWISQIGLTLYDMLAFDKGKTWDLSKKIPDHKFVPPAKALKMQPIMQKRDFTGASVFYDCISIFPERLALAFIKSSMHHNARAANYTKVTGFLMDSAKRNVHGVIVKDLIQNKTFEIQAAVTINCSGPWADSVLELTRKKNKNKRLRRSEGIHIITKKIINPESIVCSVTPSGRHCFLIPWRGHTLIGTTDKEYFGHPDDYRVTRQSIQELIDEVNATFDGLALTFKDVLHSYGGLRPLVDTGTKETYKSSRRYEIHDHSINGLNHLITVEGGKWTTSRNLAEKVVDLLWKNTKFPISRSISSRIYLKGCEIRNMETFIHSLKKQIRDFDENTVDYIGRIYGTECHDVLTLARQHSALSEKINSGGDLLAQALYAARHEMARTLKDIVLRRTGIATLGDPGEKKLLQVAKLVAEELNWDNGKIHREVQTTLCDLQLPEEVEHGQGQNKTSRLERNATAQRQL